MSTSPDFQTQINELAVRLAALDGQGLHNPSTSFVSQTNAKLNGLKTDLQQSVLTLDGLLTKLINSVNNLWTSVETALGITAQPPSSPTSVVPPSGN